MSELHYHSTPTVKFGSNTFVGVPTILQFDDTPLVSIVREQDLGFTTEIPIYHEDGTYLAKVVGTRVYATEDGEKAGVEIKQFPQLWVCTVEGRTAFEIHQEAGDAFRTQAELHTPTGFFVKVAESPQPELFSASGEELRIGGAIVSDCKFVGCRIGLWLKSDGSLSIGVG